MRLLLLVPGIMLCLLCLRGFAQNSTSSAARVLLFPDKVLGSIEQRASNYEQKLTEQSERYLNKLAKMECKLKKKISRVDSNLSKSLFVDNAINYDHLAAQLKDSVSGNYYSGHLDSLRTALHFFQANNLISPSPQVQDQLRQVLKQYGSLQGKMSQTDAIRKMIQDRQQLLKSHLEKLGMVKEFRKLQKTAYYYKAQLEEYKAAFENPSLMEVKLLRIANKIPAFRNFFNKYSELAGIFRMSGDEPVNATALAGLQTRDMVIGIMEEHFGAGANLQSVLSRSLSQGQAQVNDIGDKMLKSGVIGKEDLEMPNFKPNNQKSKSFLKRLELGTNLQNSKSSAFFPVTSDVGLSIGYKINDKSILGIGASYNVGWGKDIRHVAISHQGFGLRSFADFRIKGGFWITAGGELNYRNEFESFDILKNFSPWQQSALAGISKKYSIGKKLKGNIQLMYDFLYRKQVPNTSPLLFRFGYAL